MAHFCCAPSRYEAAELLNRLQKESKLPLLFAADFERGVSTRLMGATNFPHAMAFGADGKSRRRGELWPHYRPGIARRRRSLEFLSRCRCQLESRQSHHQHAFLRRRSQAGRRFGRRLHQGSARGRNADHGETFSRARRHGDRLAPGSRQRERGSRPPGFDRTPAFPPGHRGGSRLGDGGACHGSRARFRSQPCCLDFYRRRLRPARKATWVQGTDRYRRSRYGGADASFRKQYWPRRRRGVQGRERSAAYSCRPRCVL